MSTAALAQRGSIHEAVVLPCFWIYKGVGESHLTKPEQDAKRYQEWINTYGGEEFALLVKKAIEICDEVASQCTPAQQESFMTERV